MQKFVRFLYGFELEQEDLKKDLELVRDLIGMGGVYNVTGLQTAAAFLLPQHLNTENMLEWMDILKACNVEDAIDLCSEFLVNKIGYNKLLSSGMLTKHPEIAVKIIQENSLKPTTLHLYEHVPEVFNYQKNAPTSHKFSLQVNSSEGKTIVVTGLGLFLTTCADVEVKVTAKVTHFGQNTVFQGQVKNIRESNIVPIFFSEEVVFKKSYSTEFDVSIKGTGAMYSASNIGKTNTAEKNVHAKNKKGESTGVIKLVITGLSTIRGQIPECYFYVK